MSPRNSDCRACVPHTPCIPCIGKAKRVLAHRCDGPITAFVLIHRACELSATNQFVPSVVANALDELLVECGYLPSVIDWRAEQAEAVLLSQPDPESPL